MLDAALVAARQIVEGTATAAAAAAAVVEHRGERLASRVVGEDGREGGGELVVVVGRLALRGLFASGEGTAVGVVALLLLLLVDFADDALEDGSDFGGVCLLRLRQLHVLLVGVDRHAVIARDVLDRVGDLLGEDRVGDLVRGALEAEAHVVQVGELLLGFHLRRARGERLGDVVRLLQLGLVAGIDEVVTEVLECFGALVLVGLVQGADDLVAL